MCCGIAKAVSRRFLSEEARVNTRPSPCAVRGGWSSTGTDFSPTSRLAATGAVQLISVCKRWLLMPLDI
jgi:hypothetical protein